MGFWSHPAGSGPGLGVAPIPAHTRCPAGLRTQRGRSRRACRSNAELSPAGWLCHREIAAPELTCAELQQRFLGRKGCSGGTIGSQGLGRCSRRRSHFLGF